MQSHQLDAENHCAELKFVPPCHASLPAMPCERSNSHQSALPQVLSGALPRILQPHKHVHDVAVISDILPPAGQASERHLLRMGGHGLITIAIREMEPERMGTAPQG